MIIISLRVWVVLELCHHLLISIDIRIRDILIVFSNIIVLLLLIRLILLQLLYFFFFFLSLSSRFGLGRSTQGKLLLISIFKWIRIRNFRCKPIGYQFAKFGSNVARSRLQWALDVLYFSQRSFPHRNFLSLDCSPKVYKRPSYLNKTCLKLRISNLNDLDGISNFH